MDHRITITLEDLGRAPEVGEQLLEALLASVPDMDPLVGQDVEVATVDVVLAFDADTLPVAVGRALAAVTGALSGLELPERVARVLAEPVGAGPRVAV